MRAKPDPDPASSNGPELSDEEQRGRRQALAVLVTLGGSVVLVGLLGGSTGLGMVIQLIVLGLLGVQLFRGAGWARWVLLAFTLIGAAGNGWFGVQSLGDDGAAWAVNLSLAFIYAWCAFFLGMSKALQAFMATRRSLSKKTKI